MAKMGWGDLFYLQKFGHGTWYWRRKDTKKPIGPDFRCKHIARSWMRKNFETLAFETTVLDQ